jgi:hypothetical protein
LDRLEDDPDTGVQCLGDTTQGTQRMPFVPRRFQSADLLLGRAEKRGEFFLGQAGLLAKGDDLQGDIPGLSGLLETGGKRGVLQLFFEISVEIGLGPRSARSYAS